MGRWCDSVYDNGTLCDGGKEASDGLLYFLMVGDSVTDGLTRGEESVTRFSRAEHRGGECVMMIVCISVQLEYFELCGGFPLLQR